MRSPVTAVMSANSTPFSTRLCSESPDVHELNLMCLLTDIILSLDDLLRQDLQTPGLLPRREQGKRGSKCADAQIPPETERAPTVEEGLSKHQLFSGFR